MKHFFFSCILICIVSSLHAQLSVSGRVVSASTSEPLPGASVSLRGRETTVASGKDGSFMLIGVSGTDIIDISFVGFEKKTVKIDSVRRFPFTVGLLPIASVLQDVMISTGYQRLPVERTTGSFARIDNNLLSQQVSTNIVSRIEAVANSVVADRGTGGAGGRLMIRGLSTIRGPKEALVVVDNFPFEGDINSINPNDVADITILKDAAASSIWGAKAANGVIVITTKKAAYNKSPRIDFGSNISLATRPDLSYIPQMNSSDFIDVEQVLFDKGYYNSWINASSKRSLSPVVELLRTQSASNAESIQTSIDAMRDMDIRDEFRKYFYTNGLNQQYFLNANGGAEKMNYSLSAGYDNNSDVLKAGYERYTLRFQNQLKPFKNAEISSALFYTQGDSRSGRPAFGSVTSYNNGFLPYTRFADESGNALPVTKNYSLSYLDNTGEGKLLDWRYYPLDDYKHSGSVSRQTDMILNTGITYRLFKFLSADVKYQYSRRANERRNLNDEFSFQARNDVNRFTQINPDGTVKYIVPRGGVLDLSNGTEKSNYIRGQLSLDLKSNKSEIMGIAGWELRRTNETGSQYRYYGYDQDKLTVAPVDFTTQYPNFVTGSRTLITNNSGLTDRTTNYISTFGNIAYTYDKRYTVSASARRDASNLFGLNTNDQWNPFWSSGLAWNVSEEEFYNLSLVPYLRIRGTYGFSGNIDPAMVAASTISYFPNVSPHTQTPYARYSNYYNPELKWETSRMLNLALDFRLRNNRFSGSVEYYRKKGDNLFGEALVDYTTGIGNSIVKNVASMKGNGLDIQINSLNIDKALRWQSTLNFSFYEDEVTDYYLTGTQGSSFVSQFNNVPYTGLPGKPVYSMFAYRWAGLDPQTGDPQGYIDGTLSKEYSLITGSGTDAEDLKFYGSAIPTRFGSFY